MIAIPFVLTQTPWGAARLQSQAESILQRFAGEDADVDVGAARVWLDDGFFLAIQVNNVVLTNKKTNTVFSDVGTVDVRLRLRPLLNGDVMAQSLTFRDAKLSLAQMPQGEEDSRPWLAEIRDENQLLDPDRGLEVILNGLDNGLRAMRRGTIPEVTLENVGLDVSPTTGLGHLVLRHANLHYDQKGRLDLRVDLLAGKNVFKLEGFALAGERNNAIRSFEMALTPAGADRLKASQIFSTNQDITARKGVGSLNVRIKGENADELEGRRIELSGGMTDVTVDLGDQDALPATVDFRAVLAGGARKVEVESLSIRTGRSNFNFNGAIGPDVSAQDTPRYRFELITNDASLSPLDSSEPVLPLGGRIAGTYDPSKNVIAADDIAIRTKGGEAYAEGRVAFGQGAPAIELTLDIPSMPVSHVKQLWPFFSARGARIWVLDNLFEGYVSDSRIDFKVASGRLGNGVPLDRNEISGVFNVTDTRFSIVGDLPPVNEAVGRIAFQGSDVDIALASGVVDAKGKKVKAGNGTLTLRDAGQRPLIGKLEIDLEGDVDALASIAAQAPLNAFRDLPFQPEDLSGTAKGRVVADVPLTRVENMPPLAWRVALDFSKLAIVKPFDGISIADADGTLVVDPQQAQITADASLNGVKGKLNIIEPVRKDAVARKRSVTLSLSDENRDKLVPGLGEMVSGPVNVEASLRDEGGYAVTIDMANATLSLPWIGWSKGKGVAAKASFNLVQDGDRKTLQDFNLVGKSFGASGQIALNKGSLIEAKLTRAKLNDGDNFSVTIARSKGGYRIGANGSALDARALIKHYLAAPGTGGSGGDSNEAVRTSISANIETLRGFGGQSINGFRLDYSGTHPVTGVVSMRGVFPSGALVEAQNGGKQLVVRTSDAGAALSFTDLYRNVQGGSMLFALSQSGRGSYGGQLAIDNFLVVNEPKLKSLVSGTPPGDKRSLNQAINRQLDTTRVQFQRGEALLSFSGGRIDISQGVVRGPEIGSTFQGTLIDANNRINMTGTFMPAYGLNRVFGEIPVIGALLGNGRDRGLIGVTYRLTGLFDSPTLELNPLSAVAPGIFRSIFEYR
ncbi:DUF3971 domain-containing protein [Limoniibacter endophyticus]|uniref:DUF3971 domain-containing protein n=1 Tax=Limoniibacter endophyticus TaxID=1565040 RepID=UPI001AEEB661|nr:DUF3971 domain-containing protein [Limoniibacter endophyticus]